MVEILSYQVHNHIIRSDIMNNRSLRSVPLAVVLVVSAVILGITSDLRAQSFEGTIEFTATTERGPISMNYMMKGDNVRFESEGRPGMKAVILVNVKDNKTVMVMDQMKAYMEFDVPHTQGTEKPKPDIKKTGKSKKILGYACEQYLIKDGTRETDVWVTKALGKFQLFRMGGRQQQAEAEAWQEAVKNESAFPLFAVTREGDKEVSRMEATKIEKKSLDDSLFKIPEGYKKFDSSMMGRPRQ